MKLNREKSKLITGIVTIALVGGISVGGITIYNNVTKDSSTVIAASSTIENHAKQQEFMNNYYNNVENPDMDLFDEDFINLCQNGKLIINDEEYNLNDIYILKGNSNGNEYIYIQDYHNPTLDILTGTELPTDFKRESIMMFTYSNAFYNYYMNNKGSNNIEVNDDNIDEFKECVYSYDSTYNDGLPETYYHVHPQKYKGK